MQKMGQIRKEHYKHVGSILYNYFIERKLFKEMLDCFSTVYDKLFLNETKSKKKHSYSTNTYC